MKIFKDVFAIFSPEMCLDYNDYLARHESIICLMCRHDLPLTNFSFEENNLIEKSFYGRIPLENATSIFYFFKKGNVQRLIHELKYNKQLQVETFIGDWLGEQLAESNRFQL
jgi:predicted amidophosphoribosyltransferase